MGYTGAGLGYGIQQGMGTLSQALMGIQQRRDQEAEMAQRAEADAQRRQLVDLQIRGAERDLNAPAPDPTRYATHGGRTYDTRDPSQLKAWGAATAPKPDEVNWQTVEGADGFYQVNPRQPGTAMRLQGIQPRDRATGDQYNKQLVETADGFVWADPRTQQMTPVDPSIRPAPSGTENASVAEADDALATIRSLAAQPGPISDVALITAFNKLLDPRSTVREGEFKTIQDAQSGTDRARSWWQRLTTGQRLTPEQRADILSRAEDIDAARRGPAGTATAPPGGGQDVDALIDQMIAAGKSDAEIQAELRRRGL